MAGFEPSGISHATIVGRVVAPAEQKFNGDVTELRLAIGHGYKKDDVWTPTGTTFLTYVTNKDYSAPSLSVGQGDLVKIVDSAVSTRNYDKADGTKGSQVEARFGTLELLEKKGAGKAQADGFVPDADAGGFPA